MPSFNISDFSSNINKRGTTQTDKFTVEFVHPNIVQQIIANGRNTLELLTFRAESITLPGMNFDIVKNKPYGVGPDKSYVTNVNFETVPITFLDDKHNSILKYFYLWGNTIFDWTGDINNNFDTSRLFTGAAFTSLNPIPSFRTEYRKNYIIDILITRYDNSGEPISYIVLNEAYPVYINSTPLSWADTNEHFRLTVGMTFTKWFIQDIKTTEPFINPISTNGFSLETFGNPQNFFSKVFTSF